MGTTVAALTRSATGHSLNTPHTGSLRYDQEQPRIPAAAVTVEDADWMRRMAATGQEMTVHLEMEARMLPDAQSYNVIAEIPGTERPEEVDRLCAELTRLLQTMDLSKTGDRRFGAETLRLLESIGYLGERDE